MTPPSSIPPRHLADAVRAAREALRRMDEDRVPASLRRVASSSARRLPPPLLVSLLDQLEETSWLREAALDEWEGADSDSADPGVAISSLFLFRPDGWEERVAKLVSQAGHETLEGRLGDLKRENERLERLVDDLSRRLEEARADVEGVRSAEREAGRAAVARLEDGRKAAERARSDAEKELGGARERLRRREEELDEADRRIEDLRRRIARRERQAGESGVRGFGRGSAIEMARDLDQLAGALRSPGEVGGREEQRLEVRLPDGIRPDDRAAIEWLLQQEHPLTVLVDGYNVAHHLSEAPDGSIRRLVEEGLVRLRRLAVAPIHVVLVWDSAVAEEQWSVRGLDVRYVPDADETIVAEAARLAVPVVVITGDKELRERTQRATAVALWSRALVEWM